MRPSAAERVGLPRGRSPDRLSRAGQPRRLRDHPDQPARPAGRRDPGRRGPGLAHGCPHRPARGLLAGRRRQLRVLAAVRRRRDRERLGRPAARRGGRHGPGVVELHGGDEGRAGRRGGQRHAGPGGSLGAELRVPPRTAPAGRDRLLQRRPGHRGPVPGPLRRDRAVRADDPRSPGPADLVRPAPLRSAGVGPARPELPRPAGAHLVAGPAGGRRRQDRRRGDRQHLLPADRGREGRQRLPVGPARIPAAAERHGPGDRLRRHPLRPHRDRRAAGKRRRRHAVPGNRPRHRAGPLRVALPRPRAAVELLLLRTHRHRGLPLRRLPHQRRGRVPRRQLPGGRP